MERRERAVKVTIPYSVPQEAKIRSWGDGFRALVGGTWKGVEKVAGTTVWILTAGRLKPPKN